MALQLGRISASFYANCANGKGLSFRHWLVLAGDAFSRNSCAVWEENDREERGVGSNFTLQYVEIQADTCLLRIGRCSGMCVAL